MTEEILVEFKAIQDAEAELAVKKAALYARALGVAPGVTLVGPPLTKKVGKVKRDPTMPPRPPSGYQIFCKEQYAKGDIISGIGEGMGMAEVARRWKLVSDSTKQVYQDKSRAGREKYDAEMKAWREKNPGASPAPSARKAPTLPDPALTLDASNADATTTSEKKKKKKKKDKDKKRALSFSDADVSTTAKKKKKKKKDKTPAPPPPPAPSSSSSSSSSSDSDSDSD